MNNLITLPLPPSFNTYYIKGRFISPAGKEYRMQVISAVNRQNAAYKANIPLALEIVVNFPLVGKDKDLDNYANTKGLFDALTHADVWDDDKLIKDYHVMEGIPVKDGSVLVNIKKFIP